MKVTQWVGLTAVAGLFALLVGCSGKDKESDHKDTNHQEKAGTTGDETKEQKVKANLAKLSEEDRRLAEDQKYCSIEQDNLLGAMGKPIKLVLKGKPVFLCCPSCQDMAKENPDRTLDTVEKLKAKAKAEGTGK